jgi:hypothetical protein
MVQLFLEKGANVNAQPARTTAVSGSDGHQPITSCIHLEMQGAPVLVVDLTTTCPTLLALCHHPHLFVKKESKSVGTGHRFRIRLYC